MAPLNELQFEALKAFKEKQKPTEAEIKLLQNEINELLKHKKNHKDFSGAEDARRERLVELLENKAELEDSLQFASRLWCVDFTSEALGILLANSGEQMAVLCDEGGLVLYNMLGRYTKGDVTDDILLCKCKTVNSHAVDRVGRPPIILNQPCVSLLLLVQPDILRKALSNERLLIGGFLARCPCVDAKLIAQYEDEKTLPEADAVIMGNWNRHIRGLVKTFRFADEPWWVNVEPIVRDCSRQFHNEIIDLVRGELRDVSAFAMRWVERTWEVSLNLHSGLYGVECYREPLQVETFENASRIVRCFAGHQLEMLQATRLKAIEG
jgi:hypothetical protein